MTLGDVLGITFFIIGTGAALTALMLATMLLFPRVVERARERVQSKPYRCFGIGAVMTLTLGVLAIAMLQVPQGPVKFLGILLFFGLSCIVFVGASGIAKLMGERVNEMAKPLTPFAGLLRGSIIISVSLIFPVVGWLFLTPVAAVCALGAGTWALLSGRRRAQVQPAKEFATSTISFDLEEARVSQ
jgi:hypothetical protein